MIDMLMSKEDIAVWVDCDFVANEKHAWVMYVLLLAKYKIEDDFESFLIFVDQSVASHA